MNQALGERGGNVVPETGDTGAPSFSRWLLPAALLCLTLLLSLAVRLHFYSIWLDHPGVAYFDQTPLLLQSQGYAALWQVHEYLEPTGIAPTDASDPAFWPELGPGFLSPFAAMTALLTRVLAWSPEDLALLLPALMGSLLILPLFILGRGFKGWRCGLVAALLGAVAPHLVLRSTVGVFSPDPGTLFLAVACAALFLFPKRGGRLGLCLVSGLFLWLLLFFWEPDPVLAALLVAPPLLASMLRPPTKGPKTAVKCLPTLVSVALVSLLFHQLRAPHMGRGLNAPIFHSLLSGSWPAILWLCVGVCALLVFFHRYGLRSLYFGGFVLAAIWAAPLERGLAFLSPALAVALADVCVTLWNRGRRPAILLLVFLLGVECLAVFQVSGSAAPEVGAESLRAMSALGARTPENTVIWTSERLAWPMLCYARRRVITTRDDALPDWVIALPLALNSQRQAAGWMRFIAVRGKSGLDNALPMFGKDEDASLDRLLARLGMGVGVTPEPGDFLFPVLRAPLCLFLDSRTMMGGRWLEAAAHKIPEFAMTERRVLLFQDATLHGDELQGRLLDGSLESAPFLADLDKGVVRFERGELQLSTFMLLSSSQWRQQDYRATGLVLGYNDRFHGGVMSGVEVTHTVFHRLFVAQENDKALFRLVARIPWRAQCWLVLGNKK